MGKPISNQIVGVCRFSYAGFGGFSASQQELWELEAMLYDPTRMRQRFFFFENICLPSLAAQTDQDFKFVALIADTMPFKWRRRLKNLMEIYPFLQVCTLEAAGPLNSTRRAYKRGWDRKSEFMTGFRMDDDDAVAIDYIAKTRELADHFLEMGWADHEHNAVIAFHRGLYWDMENDAAPFHEFSEIGPLGLASAMITPVETQTNMFRWNHRKVAAHVRRWMDPTDMMFIRTLHGHNDSDRSVPPGAEPMTDHQAKTLMRDRFGLEPVKLINMMRRLRDDPMSIEEEEPEDGPPEPFVEE